MTARLIMKLDVVARDVLGDDLLRLTFRHPKRPELPAWEPGAHVDLRLPDGKIRQYSLVSDPKDVSHYAIIVRRDDAGRGGSVWIHGALEVGTVAHVSAPRNNFPLQDAPALFVAGGIGVTPMISMARALRAMGQPFALHFCCRGAEPGLVALLDDVCGPGGLVVHDSAATGRADIAALLADRPPSAEVYCCGPEGLLTGVRDAAAVAGIDDRVHAEVFAAAVDETFQPEPFDLILRDSGEILHVPADKSALAVLLEHGHAVATSCGMGVCGSCRCGYVDGTVLHRDQVLSAQARQNQMMLCVSRARVSVTIDL